MLEKVHYVTKVSEMHGKKNHFKIMVTSGEEVRDAIRDGYTEDFNYNDNV